METVWGCSRRSGSTPSSLLATVTTRSKASVGSAIADAATRFSFSHCDRSAFQSGHLFLQSDERGLSGFFVAQIFKHWQSAFTLPTPGRGPQ